MKREEKDSLLQRNTEKDNRASLYITETEKETECVS